jgi:hypothetical protein
MSLISGYYWTFKQGSIGKVLEGTLKDANGNFEITGTVTVTAKKQGSTIAVIDDEPCTPNADQVANKGDFTFTLDADTAAVDPGTYNLEFKHTSGGNVSIWPDDPNANKQYGKLVVTAAL